MRTIASSGSMLGSTPNWNDPDCSSLASVTMGDEMRVSERAPAPTGTVRRWLFSLFSTVEIKAASFSSFSSCSPKLMISTATLFFLSFLASATRSSLLSLTGEPTNAITRWRWFLFWRCFRASCGQKETGDAPRLH